MKLHTKITAGAVCLLAGALALAGLLVMAQAFAANLATAVQAARQQHTAAQTALLQAYYTRPAAPLPAAGLSAAAAQYAAQDKDAAFALWLDGSLPVFSTLPADLRPADLQPLLDAAEGGGRLYRAAGADWLLLASPLPVPGQDVLLLTGADLTAVFAARNAQLAAWALAAAAALALGWALAARFGRSVTEPLAKLEHASRAIAAGAYGSRTGLQTDDEIGALSAHFDAMAAAVQQHSAAQAENLRRQKEFVAAFTHELKTPMTTMMGYADWLRAGAAGPGDVKEAADYIYHETRRLEELSFKLLALLQLEQGAAACAPLPDRALFAAVQRSLGRGGLQVTFAAAGCTLWGDKSLLTDLLLNLIHNARAACRALPEGRVTVRSAPQGDGVLLTVQDNGCGIPAADLPRLTEPFYMVDKSRARGRGGTGVGLALCSRIAALHGTALQFTSAPGQGTTVSLALRAAPPNAPAGKEAADAPH